MQIEAIRLPQVAYPTPGTDAGTPLVPRETAIPFGAVMPAAVLPEEGAKTRDREPDPQRPESLFDENGDPVPVLPEPFKLIAARDFATILRFLSVENHHILFEKAQKIKGDRGVTQFRGYPDYYVQTLPKTESIREQYENTVFFYHTRPGNRFVGKM